MQFFVQACQNNSSITINNPPEKVEAQLDSESKFESEETLVNSDLDVVTSADAKILSEYKIADQVQQDEFSSSQTISQTSAIDNKEVTTINPSANWTSDDTGDKNEKEIEKEAILLSDHQLWNALLSKHVESGKVDYSGLKSELSKLNQYLEWLRDNPPSEGDKSRAALAYWMNAYNAFTVKLILDNYPLKSIMDIDRGKPWDTKWIQLGGATYSLNQIENEIIRPRFQEPRIHFAINCAAKSCPPLSNKAFTATNVETEMERLTKAFINSTEFNKLAENKIQLSSIFDWYAVDFGNVRQYIIRYADQPLSDKARVSFLSYDWSLNE
ncbi:MAG: DUF547 domain-containing protein [Bacteroidia bacterium]|nr:DUF547 domain-containing protein [Bacteroidia bacterium]